METNNQDLIQKLNSAKKILIGIGEEWDVKNQPGVLRAYEVLHSLVKDRDYFIVTTNSDGEILKSSLDHGRITAPCGNVTWKQCSLACTKDIWEEGERPDGICPHCGEPLTGNTILAENYIEEGYLPKWKAYTDWLARTLNQELLILELGVGFQTPAVIRWPFEKTAFFNRKSHMYRINGKFALISEAIKERTAVISVNSVEFVIKLS